MSSKDTIEVRVGRINSVMKTVSIVHKGTVADALKAAGIGKKDSEIVKVNNKEVSLSKELEDQDRVVLVKDVEGGSN